MYLMYVDESGDTGVERSPTSRFLLSGMVFHELRWNALFDSLVTFRRELRQRTGFKLRDDIHTQELINGRVMSLLWSLSLT